MARKMFNAVAMTAWEMSFILVKHGFNCHKITELVLAFPSLVVSYKTTLGENKTVN